MKLTIGFSPCPNDTFIFDALVNKKIDTEGLGFDVMLEDVETLNQWALQGRLDITKLSFPAFFQSLDKYVLLNSGGALGKGVGPLLISKSEVRGQKSEVSPSASSGLKSEIESSTIALPGINTTANLLFSFAYPEAVNKKFMIFSEIEDWLLKAPSVIASKVKQGGGLGKAGVIIHENRFTYKQKGLHKVMDLGEYWEQKMCVPVPLGGIAVKKSVDRLISLKVDKLIKKSLEYAFANYPTISDYVKQHSQTISEDVMRQHIDLYVNNYSLDLGDDGKKAIETLHQVFLSLNKKPRPAEAELFL